jgi:hypothetical protein
MEVLRLDSRSGLVAIDLPALAAGEPLYGARVSYALGTATAESAADWLPCAVVPGPYPEALLETSFWEWNEAILYGNVKVPARPVVVFWDLHASGMHRHAGRVRVRLELLGARGVVTQESTVDLVPSRAVYLHAGEMTLPPAGWTLADGAVGFSGSSCEEPLAVRPGLVGVFEVFLGIRSGSFMGMVGLGGEEAVYPLAANTFMNSIPEFDTKANKEIKWKTLRLGRRSVISLRPHPAALAHPERYAFGAIAYIKLVPVAGRRPGRLGAARLAWGDRKLALYFEPYSWAYTYGLTRGDQVRRVLGLFREMGADEIHTQVIRFGSRSLHHGRVAERHDSGRLEGDDGTTSDGPTEMVRSIDVLRESIDACRELGLKHYANAGLTNCYPGSALEDRISREHPEWREGHVLRYNRPETVMHAARIMAEFVEWGTEGVSVDCMRYPTHQTEEDLLALFRAMDREMRMASGGRRLPFTARIPAGDVAYYRAFLSLAREGIVDCIVPSTLYPKKPLVSLAPYVAFQECGCRVYGRIDGWKENLEGNAATALLPSDIREEASRFFREGADGLYVYQADAHLANPFTRRAFRPR